MNNVSNRNAESYAQEVAQLLGWKSPEGMGAGNIGFIFTKGKREIIFGYANGSLGYSYDNGSHEFIGDDMTDMNADAHAQFAFIEANLKKFKIPKI